MSLSDPNSFTDDIPQQEAEEEKSLEELEQQLSQFTEQLNQCVLLSQQEPENEEYGALIDDLQNAIQLTNELIRLKKESTTTPSSMPGPQFQEGDYCYGLYEGLWYVAVVTKVIDNTKKLQLASESPSSKKPAYEYFVRYVGYGNSEFVSKERYTIKEYYHPPAEFLQQGARCLAVNASDPDGMYEEAVVDKLTDKETVWVTFKERGVLQEVPLPLIRVGNEHFYDPKYKPKKLKKKESSNRTETLSGQPVTSQTTSIANKGTTTEQQGKKYDQSEADVIAKKKKKQEKRQQKLQEQEKQLNQKKQNWQSFMSRNSSTYKNAGKTLQATEKTYTPAQKKTKLTTSAGSSGSSRPNNR
ncbi:hypothetical protein C9374_005551 [Naegleria lovaniensis]|uniref:Tudor domain-containing protein n=1 Tax=Naegleria lovaniensis TaxID=51637 RepID=A0AA88GJX9_NAELO|nr:uncharacterized protein C9374_005551 [Naegleria lovaniensis]KAG2382349.1 hypothetical protein C9374_005551 [Naegleria lovaniensis]